MKNGFSLIELLVVVLMVGILSTIALPQYNRSVERARTAEALTNGNILLDSMNRALMLQPNVAPTDKSALDVKINGGRWVNNSTYQTKDFMYKIDNQEFLRITRLVKSVPMYEVRMYTRFVSANDNKKQCLWSTELGEDACRLFGQHGFEVSQNI